MLLDFHVIQSRDVENSLFFYKKNDMRFTSLFNKKKMIH